MYHYQRVESIIQIPTNNPPRATNWNNVQNSLFNFLANNRSNQPNPRFNQRQNMLNKISQNFDLPSDDDSFNSVNSNILSSTPVVSTPKDGSFRRPALPRISVIPKRTPLRANRNISNVQKEIVQPNFKRKSDTRDADNVKSAKKLKKSSTIGSNSKKITPKINPLEFHPLYDESPYNSPYTPNTIRNLDKQKTMYTTRMTVDQSGFPFSRSSVMTQTRIEDDDVSVKNATVQTAQSPPPTANLFNTSDREVARRNCPSTSASCSTINATIKQNVLLNTAPLDESNLNNTSQNNHSIQKTQQKSRRSASFKEKSTPIAATKDIDISIKNKTNEKVGNKSNDSSVKFNKNGTVLVEYTSSLDQSSSNELECNSVSSQNAASNNDLQNDNSKEFANNDISSESDNAIQENDIPKIDQYDEAQMLNINGTVLVDYTSSLDESSSINEQDRNSVSSQSIEQENVSSNNNNSNKNADQDDQPQTDQGDVIQMNHSNSSPSISQNSSRKNISSKTINNVEIDVNSSLNSSLKKPSNLSLSSNSIANSSSGLSARKSVHFEQNLVLGAKENKTLLVNYSSSFDNESAHHPTIGDSADEHISEPSENDANEREDSSDDSIDASPPPSIYESDGDESNNGRESLPDNYSYSDNDEDDDDENEEPNESISPDSGLSDDENRRRHIMSRNDYSNPNAFDRANSVSDVSSDESSSEQIIIRRKKKAPRSSLKKRIFKAVLGDEDDEVIRPIDTSRSRVNRRSRRNRVRPLDYWAGQRPIYKTENVNGNALVTLVGVSTASFEPTRKIVRKPINRKAKQAHIDQEPVEQKMENVLDLSIHVSKFKKKEFPTDANENIIPLKNVTWNESKSAGVHTSIVKKEANIAFGKLKFDPKATKADSRTGDYETHFNVGYGSLLLKITGQDDTVIKTGYYFHIAKQTNYSIINLRDDHAMLDFTIVKELSK